jgi:DNA invertase Pin-like site-specific DNA recombinase
LLRLPAKGSAPALVSVHWPNRSSIPRPILPKFVFAILAVAAKLEHRRIKERTARGRADAKAKGVKFGRKPKLTTHQQREAIQEARRGRRDVALDSSQLQCPPTDDAP